MTMIEDDLQEKIAKLDKLYRLGGRLNLEAHPWERNRYRIYDTRHREYVEQNPLGPEWLSGAALMDCVMYCIRIREFASRINKRPGVEA